MRRLREAPAWCRFLIAAASPLVPADKRADWVREWRTEAACSAAHAGLSRGRLALRCLGAFVHAAWLRLDRWRGEMLVQDVKLAARALARRPLFTVVTVSTLAIGIGANAAMFAAVQAVLLRPLAFPEPERIVQLYTTATGQPRHRGSTSPPDFADWRRDSASFRALAAINAGAYALTGDGPAEQVPGADVSASFFVVMGVPALHGRTLGEEDEASGGPPVAVLSHALWMRRFGGDPSAVGRRVVLDGEAREVVGVMPKGFAYPLGAEAWAPLRFSPEDLATQRGAHYLDVVGRLGPGATIETARAELLAIGARLARAYPRTNRDAGIAVEPLRDAIVGEARRGLLALMGAVSLVLVMVCVNVAGLVFVQSLGRRRELAVRRTLGAGRARLVLGLLAESALLGLAGGAAGLLLATWATGALAASAESLRIPLLDQSRVDATVLGFTALLSIGVAALFGAMPAWRAGAGRDLAARLRSDSPQVAGGRGRLRGLLIVTETALAGILLVGAGLLGRSLAHLRSVELGVDTARIQTFSVSLPEARYASPERRAAFVDALLARLRALPDVESAGAVFGLPLSGFGYSITTRELDGRVLDDVEQDRLSLHLRVATPGYFETMGQRLVRGRSFEAADGQGAPVVVVSESAAALLWPGADPIGRRITMGTTLGQGRGRAGGEVVGVVGDVRHRGPQKRVHPTLYLAHAQFPVGFASVVARARRDSSALAPALRTELAALDDDVPMFQVRTMDQVAADAVAQPRAYSLLLGIFAATAVLLAALGLYGVLAQAVGERSREIGIRMAVGAARGQVVLLVVAQGGRLALAGIGLGLAAATLASRAWSGLLFGVAPLDPLTYAAVGAVLLAVAVLASWLPARRAARVDPVQVLRAE